MRELIAEEKLAALEVLADPIRRAGVKVETKVLLGKTSIEIIREVLRGEHDLVLRVAKGRDSTRQAFFGNTAMRLLRKCPSAVWLVSPTTTPKFKHVLGCIDTSSGDKLDAELNNEVHQLASSISQYHGGRYSIIHAWSIWNEQMIKSRMKPEEFEEMERSNHDQLASLLDKFLQNHGTNVRAENVHLMKGEAPAVISQFVHSNDVDLVVMGTVARSGVAGVVMGNTAEQILNGIQCSVLALKPSSFICPIHFDE
jgi:nucleotide-binding universal stress UspA family protein